MPIAKTRNGAEISQNGADEKKWCATWSCETCRSTWSAWLDLEGPSRSLTLCKKNRPAQPSRGRSTVAAAPRRNDHSSLR